MHFIENTAHLNGWLTVRVLKSRLSRKFWTNDPALTKHEASLMRYSAHTHIHT